MRSLLLLDRVSIGIPGRTLLEVDRLEVRPGDRIALVGPSGSGKSLTLAALAGRLPHPVAVLAGSRVAGPLRIGVVPQRGQDALHPLLAVGRQLAAVTRRPRADVVAALERLGLDAAALWGRRPAELSGGQAQRVTIALAALGVPDLVLADEPTSALDPESRDETLALLLGLVESDSPAALVVATHDPAVPRLLGARTLRVTAGVVVAEETAGATAHGEGSR